MPSTTTNPERVTLATMKAERSQLMQDLTRLDTAIAAWESYVGGGSRGPVSAPARQPAKAAVKRAVANHGNGQKAPTTAKRTASGSASPAQTAILSVIRSSNKDGWSTADLAKALTERRVITTSKGAADKVRKALGRLKERGVVVSKRQGSGKFARTTWTLAKAK